MKCTAPDRASSQPRAANCNCRPTSLRISSRLRAPRSFLGRVSGSKGADAVFLLRLFRLGAFEAENARKLAMADPP
jgi:hypothetical protein